MQITDSHIVAAHAAVFSLLSVVSNLFACQTFFYVHRLSMRMYLELVSKELNHFGVIAGLFWQIGGHSSRFVLFCSF